MALIQSALPLPFRMLKKRYRPMSSLVVIISWLKIVHQKLLYTGQRRPKKGSKPVAIAYYVNATVKENKEFIQTQLDQRSCYVIGTNIAESALSVANVITAYKQQNASIENLGFRFLKDPLFFVSSLFLKKPSRI